MRCALTLLRSERSTGDKVASMNNLADYNSLSAYSIVSAHPSYGGTKQTRARKLLPFSGRYEVSIGRYASNSCSVTTHKQDLANKAPSTYSDDVKKRTFAPSMI